MAEKNVYADALGEYLWKTKEFGFKEAEILVIQPRPSFRFWKFARSPAWMAIEAA